MTYPSYDACIDFPDGLSPEADKAVPIMFVCVSEQDAATASLNAMQRNWLSSQGFDWKAGTPLLLPDDEGSIAVVLVGLGDNPQWDAAAAATALPSQSFVPDMRFAGSCCLADIQLGWGLAQYQFAPHESPRIMARLVLTSEQRDVVVSAQIQGISLTREMINQPANIMTPAAIEAVARQIANTYKADITVVSDEAELARMAPAIHVVGRAAEVAPRMIDMRWGTEGPLVTLIGKGVTFDSGGLDIKPSRAMEMMKKDMGGAAHVLGLARALMASSQKLRLRVLIGAAENAISERSMRPLDVINTAAGIKVEVGNTDAEGRLILADLLYHAQHTSQEPSLSVPEDWYSPDFMIDFATLTGAARVALGTECPALFCNQDHIGTQMMEIGHHLDDPVWRLPLFENYDRMLDGGQAGLSSTGSSGYGGAITAALFLRRFAGRDTNWAHIDVMAWNLSSRAGRPKGGEAMGLRTAFALIAEQRYRADSD